MASNYARILFQRSTTTATSFLGRRKAPSPSQLGGLAPTKTTPASRLSRPHHFSSRLPVELCCGCESLMPLHSVTASSLLKSMLSSKVGQWGSLSEGFATPL